MKRDAFELDECYRILDLEPGASPEDIKRSWRELVKVWHPDRFTNDPKLQAKAQEKIKQINLAYEQLSKADAPRPSESTRTSTANSPENENPRPSTSSASSSGQKAQQEPPRPQTTPPPPPAPNPNWGRRLAQAAITIVVIVFLKAVLAPSPRSITSSSPQTAYTPQPSQPYYPPQIPTVQPKPRQHLTIEQILPVYNEAGKRQPNLNLSVREFCAKAQASQTEYDFSEGLNYEPPAPLQPQPYVPATLASKPADPPAPPPAPATATDPAPASSPVAVPVSISQPETPNNELKTSTELASLENKLPLSLPSKPSLPTTKSPPETARSQEEIFTVGSTKAEVVAIHGEPTRFSDRVFYYGTSSIEFDYKGKVENWHSGSIPLKAQYYIPAGEKAKDFFTVGSSKAEVLAIHGEPTSFSERKFYYGTSTVEFDYRGKVENWHSGSVSLKAQYYIPAGEKAKDFFTVGSSKADVLAIHGEPTSFSERKFYYGTSTVEFDYRGKVENWHSGSVPLKAQYYIPAGEKPKDFFTVGSSKAEVLAIHGEPTRFSDRAFYYGTSSVEFDYTGKVENWHAGSMPLKARYYVPTGEKPKEFFTVGSTKAEVLAIHGEPTRFSDRMFFFGTSTVQFDYTGKVENWRKGSVSLKARYYVPTGETPKEFFTVGSTKAEVLAIHGEPTRFNDRMFFFGTSTVEFDYAGKVEGWRNGTIPLKARRSAISVR